MRITGGEARGRRLGAPRGLDIRPTSDRVRKAMFDLVGRVDPGTRVIDLFAGTGALGIEAVSRGAGVAVLVDRDPRAAAACTRNARVLGGRADSIRVVRADVFAFLRRGDGVFPADLVFLDPPYAFDRWGRLWRALIACGALRSGSIVLGERSTRGSAGRPAGLRPVRSVRYGDTAVDLWVVEHSEEIEHGA